MILLSTSDRRRYFLVPDPAALAAGELLVQSMTGESRSISAEAGARYEVPEAVARAWAEEQVGHLGNALAAAREQLDQITADARRDIEPLSRRAGLQDPGKILAALGLDPAARPDHVLRQLVELVRRLGAELPDAARDLLALEGVLRAASPGAPTEPPPGRLDALLTALAGDPDADPELKQATAELQALARTLQDPASEPK
jgi:hypothetical protein